MKKIYSVFFLTFLIVISATTVNAQDYWQKSKATPGKIATDKSVARLSFPKQFELFDLNLPALKTQLFKVVGNQVQHTVVISVPNAAGAMETFSVNEASNFDAALQAQFPAIRAFSGTGITDKGAMLKLSISPQGIETMIFRIGRPAEFMEPYSLDHATYAVYSRNAERNGTAPWVCTTQDEALATSLTARVEGSNFTGSNTGELKVMRLAQSCNGEYANYFGATSAAQVGLVLAAFNATLTRCNGCYEKDLAIHLNLIAGTTAVIYYDPATDPYTTLANWNTQLQTALTANVGDAAYDIGHMFGASGGGGNAGCIGCVCVNGTKGRGITSPADGIPMGDNFDIDYVVHEVGHQMGGNHTFSNNNEGTGVNKEVGSGITIMGYAGITAQDPAPHSLDIYHEATIQQIQVNMATKTCPVTTVITPNNATPVVAPVASIIVPISTPFALTASASDLNAGDVLTYCWEQNDDGGALTGNSSVAAPAKLTGPNFISFSPTTSPTRLFPRLATINAGLSVTPTLGGDAVCNVEALSSVDRILNFRVTVRDNSPYSSTAPIKVGQTAFTDMAVTVSSAVGPFLITSQNAAVTYAGGSTQTVTWSVNGTTGAPTNTANVKISWSTDNGATFVTLIATTANDGTETITVPSTVTTTGRVKVEAIGNVYFDINNAPITVSAPVNGFTFNATTPTTAPCPAGTPTVNIGTTVSGTFTTPINLTASGVPAGTTVTFAPNPLTPGAATVASLNNASSLAPGTYNISVTGTAGAVIQTTTITYIISATATITNQPTAQTTCVGSTATFSVTATGTGLTYQWQSGPSATGTFTNVATGGTAASYTTPAATLAMNGTYYRVIVTSPCGSVTSNAVMLTVIQPITVTQNPVAQRGCALTNYTFSVSATGTGIAYQWQVSTNGGATYTNIAGATSATYTITNAALALSGNLYRVIITATPCGTVTTPGVSLTLAPKPTVVLTAANGTTLNPSNVSGLYTTVSPVGNYLYDWRKNGVQIPNTLGSTSIPLTVDNYGTYQVSVIEVASGCTATSNVIVIDSSVSSRLFIYPNPVTTNMQVRYYSSNPAARGTTLNVYDSKGARVAAMTFANVSGTYGRMDVDMSKMVQGVYMVEVRDASGKRLASASVLKSAN